MMFFFLIIPDTESAKASRRQLKEAIYSALFGMNVPTVCAINQVDCFLLFFSFSEKNYGVIILRKEIIVIKLKCIPMQMS